MFSNIKYLLFIYDIILTAFLIIFSTWLYNYYFVWICNCYTMATRDLSDIYTTLAWASKGAARCLTHILPGKYHGKAVCH